MQQAQPLNDVLALVALSAYPDYYHAGGAAQRVLNIIEVRVPLVGAGCMPLGWDYCAKYPHQRACQ